MTRNNLDVHISWLTSSRANTPVGVQTRSATESAVGGLEAFGISAEDLETLGEEDLEPNSSPVRHRESSPARFPRPTFPTSRADARTAHNPRSLGPIGMGKDSTSHRVAMPVVVNQYQLATPASTTTSTAGYSSLTQNYASLLRREDGETPSFRRPMENVQLGGLNIAKDVPQTPRQTPRQMNRPTNTMNIGDVDSVDLTGEHSLIEEGARSSSTEIVFRDPKTVWTPGAAARPEPAPRTSRKRKSDDLTRSSVKKRTSASSRKAKQSELNLEGFMDIDEVIIHGPQSVTPLPRSRMVLQGIEGVDDDDELEEVKVTETIFRTETRTRTSLSRVPSAHDNARRKLPSPDQKPSLTPRNYTASGHDQATAKVQVIRSPSPRKLETSVPASPSPQKRSVNEKRQSRRIIQDSDDDDEIVLEEATAALSPRSLRASPVAKRLFASQNQKGTLVLAPVQDGRNSDFPGSIPRTTSPLRAISTNVVDRNIPLPSKRSASVATLDTSPSASTQDQKPSSNSVSDEKSLVQCFLSHPITINSYFERIKTMKSQSSEECMAYTDNSMVVPPHLKAERIRILDMEKAYQRLEQIPSIYQDLKCEKRNIARQISELLDIDEDTTHLEERQPAITKKMKDVEKEVALLLHSSGAIRDGFGTEIPQSSLQVPSKSSSKPQGPIPSSIMSSAQVVHQTQFPSLQPDGATALPRRSDILALRPSPGRDLHETRNSYNRSSPSPVRKRLISDQQSFQYRERDVQPNVLAQAAPPNTFVQGSIETERYGFDNDADFDEMLIAEAEGIEAPSSRGDIPAEYEEDYGDSDDDGFLEVAERFETRPAQSRTTPATSKEASLRTPGNAQPQTVQSNTKDMYQHVDPAHQGLMNFSWSKDVKRALRERFHLRGFRQNQLDAINATLAGKDVFVLMPTGGGKSLCYQLPAVVRSGKTKGVTVVISPLLSLMSDQVDHLRKINIQAVLVNGEQAKKERDLVFNALCGPYPDQYVQVLYITPEMVGKSKQLLNALTRLHQGKRLARIVIDEAHCVSQWGHDFRPDYKTLSNLRTTFPGVPFMALTATATDNVKADCIHNLGMEGCEQYKQSFNRPNLYYEIRSKTGKGAGAATMEGMIDLITNKYKKQSGIVYTLSRNNCEELARKFQVAGIKAHHFHAHMEPEEKSRVQRAWQTGEYQVVVATIAFGMGIDKADVRFVIHHTIPKSLEGYYQETGRAGRDGKPSGCYLFYGFQDTAVLRRFIDDGEGEEDVKEQQRHMLNRMVQFCENRNDCRRANILSYFGESFPKENCNSSCDNCASGAVYETVDMTDLAKQAVQFIKEFRAHNVTLLYVVEVLRGSRASRIKPEHRDIECHGIAKDLQRGEVERLFTRLLMDNILVENNVVNKSGFVTPYLHTGPAARDFMRGGRRLKLQVKVSSTPKAATRPAPRRKAAVPTSTILTSPITPSARNHKGKGRAQTLQQDDSDEDDDFVVNDDYESSDEEAFEPRNREPPSVQYQQRGRLGPPITTDGRMDQISDLHRDVVESFVVQAKKLEENLRNRNNHSRRYFSETQFREMAINWTLSLDMMKEIPEIDHDKVDRFGKKFLPLIERFHRNFEEIMGHTHDRDMDENHQNVINLCSDDEAGADLNEEEQSRYFVPHEVEEFNQQMALAQQLPQQRREIAPAAPKQSFRGGGFKSKKGKSYPAKKYARKSTGSEGSSSSRAKPVGRTAVTKKATVSRKGSTASSVKRKNSGTVGGSTIMQQFTRTSGSGSGSGGGGGGIMMMPM